MGTQTTNFKFYKPATDEFVDVKTQLNDNWDIADRDVRRLLEWEYSNLAVPSVINAKNRSKFFKIYSNSLVTWFTTGTFWQDPKTYVSPWISVKKQGFIGEDFREHALLPAAYRVIKKTGSATAEIEWTGAFQAITGGVMDADGGMIATTIIFPDVIPVGIRPAVSTYFVVNAGNTTTHYSWARLIFTSAGELQFYRYGPLPSSGVSNENRIELTGVIYNLEVTG